MMGNRSKTADETDAAQHKNDIVFNHGARRKIRTSAHRRDRRSARQALRSGRYEG